MFDETQKSCGAYPEDVMRYYAGGDPTGSEVAPENLDAQGIVENNVVQATEFSDDSTGDPNGSVGIGETSTWAVVEADYPIRVSLDNAAGDPTGT